MQRKSTRRRIFRARQLHLPSRSLQTIQRWDPWIWPVATRKSGNEVSKRHCLSEKRLRCLNQCLKMYASQRLPFLAYCHNLNQRRNLRMHLQSRIRFPSAPLFEDLREIAVLCFYILRAFCCFSSTMRYVVFVGFLYQICVGFHRLPMSDGPFFRLEVPHGKETRQYCVSLDDMPDS